MESHEEKPDGSTYRAYVKATDEELVTAEQLEVLISGE
jgi:hypothetical protein